MVDNAVYVAGVAEAQAGVGAFFAGPLIDENSPYIAPDLGFVGRLDGPVLRSK